MTLLATIVVPTRNRAGLLEDTLTTLLGQEIGPERYEIIVVDDGSRPPVVPRDRVTVIRHQRPAGPNAARNTGMRAAASDVIVFVDDDIEAPESWLGTLLEGVERYPSVHCFTGRVLLRLEAPRARLCNLVSYMAQGETEVDFGTADMKAPWACSANLAIRRSAFENVGGFLESHPIYGDETEWVQRLQESGGDVMYLADAMVWHRRTRADLRLSRRLRRAFRRGYGDAFTRALAEDPYDWPELARLVAGIPGLLMHSARHGCTHGICSSASECGRVWWTIRGQRPGDPDNLMPDWRTHEPGIPN